MLVIFDCDGVLVDSENLAAHIFSQCLQDYGVTMSAKMCYQNFKGHTLDYCLAWLQENIPSPAKKIDVGFIRLLEAETQKGFAESLQAVEGIELVLKRLQEKCIPFCVASNGAHKKIAHSLERTGLLHFFEGRQFSREDVRSGKPSPDLFLYAAECSGVEPRFVKVVEDSLSGVKAAQAAGMQTLLYAANREDWHEQFIGEVKEGRAVKVFYAMPRVLELLGIA